MATLTVRAHGPVPPDEAWDRYARPARWSSWSPQITRVSYPDERLSAGGAGRVHGPLGLSVDFRVDTWDDAERVWSWTVRRGPVRLRLEHGVTARGAGSETWLRASGLLPLLVGYLPVARFALHRLVSLDLAPA